MKPSFTETHDMVGIRVGVAKVVWGAYCILLEVNPNVILALCFSWECYCVFYTECSCVVEGFSIINM